MHKADILLIICLFYLGGIFCASFFIPNYLYGGIICIVAGIMVIGLFWKKPLAVYGFGLLFLAFGILNFGNNLSSIFDSSILKFDQEKVTIRGRVARDSEGFEKQKISVEVLSVNDIKGEWGNVLVYGDKYSEAGFGDVIEVIGTLKKPENFSNFDYRGYLAKEGIAAIITNPKINIIKSGEPNFFISGMLYIKSKISSAIDADFVPEQAAIVQAMVLGESEKMSDDFKKDLSKSGISHAIAISGSHFVLIASFLFSFFLFLGFWKKQSLVLVLFLIFCYIILISFPASSVRAGIMIGFIYLAKIVNRQAQDWRMLVLAAFLMCIQNPLLLKYDLGFQLSFLAVAGLIFLAPLIDNFLVKIFKERMDYFRDLLSATLAAQIFVLPILFFVSQSFSIFSIVANILIIPVMPICLALGFVYCFLFFIPFIHSLIAFLLYPLIFYLTSIVSIFSATPFVYFSFPFWMVIVSYVLMGVFIYKNKKKFLF